MSALRKFLLTLTALVAVSAVTLVSGPVAIADSSTSAASSAVTDGCDGTSPPPSNTDKYFGLYEDTWISNACIDCNIDAWVLGALGWATYCWETVSPGVLAELWYGSARAGTPAADPVVAEKIAGVTSREELRELAKALIQARG